jgi:hypothetical protein
MTTKILPLPLKADYARWGEPEALREHLQNARDAHTDGHAMSVSYDDASTMALRSAVTLDSSWVHRQSAMMLQRLDTGVRVASLLQGP